MPRTTRPIRLAELASHLGRSVEGDADLEITGFASLGAAGPQDLVFVRDATHVAALARSAARAVVTTAAIDVSGRSAIRSDEPAHDFSQLISAFAPVARPAAGIAPGAYVATSARVDPSASIAAGASIGPDCTIGPRTVVAANVSLAAAVEIGGDCWIHAGVVVREQTRVGDRVVLQPGVVLGADGFGYVPDSEGRPRAMAQRGCVVIEDDVEIGANTTVDRATLDETRIRRGAKIDNQVQIAHNCDIGENALIVAQTGLSGGTVVGRGAIVMAGVGTTGHLRIGAGAFIAARAGLHHDVPDGARMYGAPAVEERGWHRTVAALRRLPELVKRVRRLERRLERVAERSEAAGEREASRRSAGGLGSSAGDSGRD